MSRFKLSSCWSSLIFASLWLSISFILPLFLMFCYSSHTVSTLYCVISWIINWILCCLTQEHKYLSSFYAMVASSHASSCPTSFSLLQYSIDSHPLISWLPSSERSPEHQFRLPSFKSVFTSSFRAINQHLQFSIFFPSLIHPIIWTCALTKLE